MYIEVLKTEIFLDSHFIGLESLGPTSERLMQRVNTLEKKCYVLNVLAYLGESGSLITKDNVLKKLRTFE